MKDRHYTLLDRIIATVHDGLTTILSPPFSSRTSPSAGFEEPELSSREKESSRGCMRVNHSGEVCAQALYRGQAVFAKSAQIHEMLREAALEETDHLAWCHHRLEELGTHRSFLNVFWYWNSFLIGMITSKLGDRWSLGFVEETEKQVARHLDNHLHQLPSVDCKSRVIVEQMKIDETHHGTRAKNMGAIELPESIKKLMALHAKVMTTLSYWI